MLFDLSVSHPTYGGGGSDVLKQVSVIPNSATLPERSASPLLTYTDFVSARTPSQQQSQSLFSYPPSQSPNAVYSQQASSNISPMYGGYYNSQIRGSSNTCHDVQQHFSQCLICRRYMMWQIWKDMGFWLVLGLVIIYLLRK